MPPHEPEVRCGCGEPDTELHEPGSAGERECRPEIVVLALVRRVGLVHAFPTEGGDELLGQLEKMIGVTPPDLGLLVARSEPFDCVLPDRLQHPVATVIRSAHETPLGQLHERAGVPADGVDGVASESSGESAEPLEQQPAPG